ncbi:MAG: hypothetical protein HRU09_07195 [Oligoflexales bacterium]|nr:hypothetical protein [Oligoflexales bacterium]
MSMSQFIQGSGFKVLAMARLSPCEYSVILYLMNCAVSGLDQIITTEAELCSLIGYEEEEIRGVIESLAQRNLIRARYKDASHPSVHPSLRLGFQFDMDRWHLSYEEDVTSHDAVVYPFVRNHKAQLEVIPESKEQGQEATQGAQTWQRVLDSFLDKRSLDDNEIEENVTSAKILVETHPVDQVLLLLRHFKSRIFSLSLLASNWDHFQELYEEETQKVDLMDARKKHQELDDKLKESSKNWLENAEKHKLNLAEINILKLLIRHRHPRRQLFWAYQARSRYVNLEIFFEENSSLMLAITSSGAILKKPNHTNF